MLCMQATAITAVAAITDQSNHWDSTTQVGIAGLVVTLITAPFVRWTLKRLDIYHQDTAQIRQILEELLHVVKTNSQQSNTTCAFVKTNSGHSSEQSPAP
jgi:hypothetical protein